MRRVWLVLGTLLAGAAWGQAPAYTQAGIVNVSDYSAGPFAPNSVLSIFGTNLAWSAQQLSGDDIVNDALPTRMNGVEVYIDNWPAPLIFVSPSQINFVIPGNELAGTVPLRVVRQGVTGPEISLVLTDAAPALFASTGTAIATQPDGTLLTADAPAHPGDCVVIYATGLGKTSPNPGPGVIPLTPDPVVAGSKVTVYLNGVPVDPGLILYIGVSPYSAGLYQLNLIVPANTPATPEIRVAAAGQMSIAGLQLMVQ